MYRHFKDYDFSRLRNARHTKIKTPITIYSLIATWFFIGKSPIAPGTLGSLAVYPIYYFVITYCTSLGGVSAHLYVFAAFCFVFGWWAIQKFQTVTKSFDHKSVIIDEVIGQTLTLAICYQWLYDISKYCYTFISIHPKDLTFLLAFITFRFFDIYKPFIIKYVDRNYKHALGVIMDDVLAALFASGTIYIVYLIYDAARFYS